MNIDSQHYQATSLQKIAALFLPCYGYIGILGVPMSFGAIIEGFSVDAATATIATTAEILCISIASLFVSLALSVLRPRTTILAGLILIIASQVLTIHATEFHIVVFVRGITGLGEGLCIAMSLASLAQMRGGTTLLSYTTGLSAALTLSAFLAVPLLQDSYGVKAIFWFMLAGAITCVPFAFIFSNAKIARLIDTTSLETSFNLRNTSLFALCLLASIGANTCWLYFEQVGHKAGLELSQIGLVGSVSMLCAILVPFAANLVFNRLKNIVPLLIMCLALAVTSYLYVVPVIPLFWVISICMTLLYAFLLAYARMYSSHLDSTGRTTAAVGGADALGMVIGPVIAAVTLNLDGGFSSLGSFGLVMQLLCIIPVLSIILSRKCKSTFQETP